MKKICFVLCLFWGTWTAAAEIGPSARRTFYRWCQHLSRGEIDQARKVMLSAEELGSFARWQLNKDQYRQRVDEFLQGMSEELKNYVRLQRAETTDALVMLPNGKISRQVIMVVIHAFFEPQQKNPKHTPQAVPFHLILHGGQWKLWLR